MIMAVTWRRNVVAVALVIVTVVVGCDDGTPEPYAVTDDDGAPRSDRDAGTEDTSRPREHTGGDSGSPTGAGPDGGIAQPSGAGSGDEGGSGHAGTPTAGSEADKACAEDNGGCDFPGATCNEVVGGPRTCTCPSGTEGDGDDAATGCIDIDCSSSTCGASQPCRDVTPGYTCLGQFEDWSPSDAPSTFTVQGTTPSDTVTDSRNGLVWQRTLGTANHYWPSAIAYCEDLDYASFKDWRLPTIAELESILDLSRQMPAIDVDTFPGADQTEHFWSSTVSAADSVEVWHVVLTDGSSHEDGAPDSQYKAVRCVR
jgi:hypothetical protein